MAAAPPQVGRRTIEALLARHATRLGRRRLVLVHGSYRAAAAAEFTVQLGGETRRVRVSDQACVLGILQTWYEHQDATAGTDDVLVVTTGLDDAQLGFDLLGHAVKRRTLTVDAAEIVKQRFGATELDSRMYRESWLLDALLDAEPAEGWPRVGVLTRDTAVRALLLARLGLRAAEGDPVGGLGGNGQAGNGQDVALDADTLLAWSRTAAGPRRFAELAGTERAELKRWLGENAGAAAPVLMSLVEAGQGADAMALGLLGGVLRDPEVSPDVVLAVGGLYGQVIPRRSELAAFAEAVEGTLTRWIGEAQSGNEGARQRVFAVIDRADRLAEDAGLTGGLAGRLTGGVTGGLSGSLDADRFLRAGFTAQLRRVAACARQSPAAGESALADLAGHALARLYRDRVEVAEMAVRLARWLALPRPQAPSLAAGVRGYAADWAWADRALTVLWAGDPGGDPAAGQDFRALYDAARERRADLDEGFAVRLAAWAAHATARHPGGARVVENVLTDAVRPLLGPDGAPAPLVVVLDGMSGAVAAQLGEEAEREGWTEAVPAPPVAGDAPERVVAVSMFPSVTETSRASLLTGEAAKGGQAVEAAGFAAFFKRHRRDALLFHKAAVGGATGQFLAEEIAVALASDAVVGVVLNTIDDALDKGREGRRTRWRLRDITYLPELLTAARNYGRPVVLVADHGHVLERGESDGPSALSEAAGGARWRTGEPVPGEVLLSGPRVLEGGGTIVAPWREGIRYTGRRAGYHGGATPAEVSVPVLVLVPSKDALPKGWVVLPREQARPKWWEASKTEPEGGSVAALSGQAAAAPATRRQAVAAKRRQLPEGEGLFTQAEAVAMAGAAGQGKAPALATLGALVVASEVYEAQKAYVRKAPEAPVVAAVIDKLVQAGGTMSPAALAAAISATGRVRRNIDGFVATVQRLLNVEGYPVLGFIDSRHTVKLDECLLREQFRLEDRSRSKEGE